MQSASDTPSSHSRRGWRSPRRRAAATAWRSRPRSGAHRGIKGCRQGASPSGGRSLRTDSRATRDTLVCESVIDQLPPLRAMESEAKARSRG
jgi:hypothetical protein